MSVLAPTEETGDFEARSYMHWLATDVKNVSLHTTSAYLIYSRLLNLNVLQKHDSVLEYFGGAGIHSRVIYELLEPSRHRVVERSEAAWKQICFDRGSKAEVISGNFEDYRSSKQWDVVHVDHPRFSISRFRHHYKEFFHILNHNKPKVFILTDTSRNKFHLNIEPFRRALDRKIESFEDYLYGTSALFQKEFGFTTKLCALTRFSCMMAMTKDLNNVIEMMDVNASEQEVKGFEWTSGYLSAE